jgi:hypothetical protein
VCSALAACRRIAVIGGSRRRKREDAMDSSAFDKLVRLVGGGSTRRIALKSALAGGALTAVGLASSAMETAAKKKKKKCKCKPKDLGDPCTSNKQCCTNETNRLCAIPSDPSSSQTVCCGGVGAQCDSTDDCCGDFTCESGLCDS